VVVGRDHGSGARLQRGREQGWAVEDYAAVLYMCVSVCVCVSMYIYIYKFVYKCIHVFIYVRVYVCVCVCD